MIVTEIMPSDTPRNEDGVLDGVPKSLDEDPSDEDPSSLTISTTDVKSLDEDSSSLTRYTTDFLLAERIVNIADKGDVIMVATGGKFTEMPPLFRVDSGRLRSVSPYFEVLFGNDKFKEGVLLRETHEKLREEGLRPSEAPAKKLPRITITDMGQIVPSGPGSYELVDDFLRILHGLHICCLVPRINYLAGLACLADRFDCLPVVAKSVKERGLLLARQRKKKNKTWESLTEQGLRQRILVGWLFDDSVWFRAGSHRLIMRGTRLWSYTEDSSERDESLWWNLPDGIEGCICFFEHDQTQGD